jgi:hypothetical protein
MIKYYTVRILAAFFFMGSIGVGFIIGAEYDNMIGWLTFFLLVAIGLFLHFTADKTKNGIKS